MSVHTTPLKCTAREHRYLAELELRLHLASEDVDAALEIDSGRALQRIPAAVEEVAHVQVGSGVLDDSLHCPSSCYHCPHVPLAYLSSVAAWHMWVAWLQSGLLHKGSHASVTAMLQGDVLSLKTDVGRGLSSVSGAAAAAGSNVALLVQLERMKSRMEAACSTLKVCSKAAAKEGMRSSFRDHLLHESILLGRPGRHAPTVLSSWPLPNPAGAQRWQQHRCQSYPSPRICPKHLSSMWFYEQEATELSAQFARVEGVFAEGDVHRISGALAGIRRGLALVGDVPEFRGGPERLKVGFCLIAWIPLSSHAIRLGPCACLHAFGRSCLSQ